MELALSPAEQQSPLGRKLHTHFTDRLAYLRQLNDKAMDLNSRAELIAQIAEVKALIRAFEQQALLRTVAPA
jgi:hypothetical protein